MEEVALEPKLHISVVRVGVHLPSGVRLHEALLMRETRSSARELMLALAVGLVIKTLTARDPYTGVLVPLGIGV